MTLFGGSGIAAACSALPAAPPSAMVAALPNKNASQSATRHLSQLRCVLSRFVAPHDRRLPILTPSKSPISAPISASQRRRVEARPSQSYDSITKTTYLASFRTFLLTGAPRWPAPILMPPKSPRQSPRPSVAAPKPDPATYDSITKTTYLASFRTFLVAAPHDHPLPILMLSESPRQSPRPSVSASKP